MNQTTQIDPTKIRSIILSKFIEPGFEYWFTNHQHIRSPFPSAIKETVRERTSEIFFEWISGLKEKKPRKVKKSSKLSWTISLTLHGSRILTQNLSR